MNVNQSRFGLAVVFCALFEIKFNQLVSMTNRNVSEKTKTCRIELGLGTECLKQLLSQCTDIDLGGYQKLI